MFSKWVSVDCFRGWGLGWTVEGWSASDPWEWNAFPFVALHFLTGCPSTWAWWGCFYYPASQTLPPQSTLFCLFPKRLAFLGATSEAALEAKACWLLGGLLCTGSKGRRQCLINWLGVLGRVQEFAEGGDRKVRWGMSWEGWRGGTTGEKLQSSFFFSVLFTKLLGRWDLWWYEDVSALLDESLCSFY